MTRKRFIKLLMGHGVSRNEAQARAYLARNNGSYKDGYYSWERWNSLYRAVDKLSVTLGDITKGFSTLCLAVGVAASAFSDTFHAAVQAPELFSDEAHDCVETDTHQSNIVTIDTSGGKVQASNNGLKLPWYLGWLKGRLNKEENQ